MLACSENLHQACFLAILPVTLRDSSVQTMYVNRKPCEITASMHYHYCGIVEDVFGIFILAFFVCIFYVNVIPKMIFLCFSTHT